MAARHRKKARGGAVYYTGKGSNVEKEAEEKKHGGRTHAMKVHGSKGKHRFKRGGRVGGGSDKHPWSSAGGPTAGQAAPHSADDG